MASDPHTPFAPTPGEHDTFDTFGYGAPRGDGPWEEWNPTEETLPSARGGRHRVAKQRGGGLARSSTVLGVGVIAAVGAGGMASANTGKPPVSIALPDLPGVDSLLDHGSAEPEPAPSLSAVGSASAQSEEASDAGEALRSRIIAQAAHQQSKAESRATAAAVAAADKQTADAADKAAKEAAAQAADAKEKAEADARKKAESDRLASLAKQYTLPTSGYTITGTFGEPGALWSSGYHTGLDFAAPTGTLIKAIHGGTVTQAGWAGAYGYRTVLTLDDGTELWFCHQSSISVKTGQKVATGEVIGRVGATGNVTGPHLHLEVHPGGQATGIDPMTWLRGKGLNP
ncbi:M23 family metallopeptidase [Streptomyces sp. NPDC059597]|uniref:M23 family metallopeptidase n=1 Tax=Streptomyces sp. NPDC059597 TaxID=3346879 RepID=UPI0036C9E275